MIDWDIIKAMGIIYIVLTLMILGISFSISLISCLPMNHIFWGYFLATSSAYWGLTFLVAIFEN